jgi:hypothetical protein
MVELYLHSPTGFHGILPLTFTVFNMLLISTWMPFWLVSVICKYVNLFLLIMIELYKYTRLSLEFGAMKMLTSRVVECALYHSICLRKISSSDCFNNRLLSNTITCLQSLRNVSCHRRYPHSTGMLPLSSACDGSGVAPYSKVMLILGLKISSRGCSEERSPKGRIHAIFAVPRLSRLVWIYLRLQDCVSSRCGVLLFYMHLRENWDVTFYYSVSK